MRHALRLALSVLLFAAAPSSAQRSTKSAVQVDPGGTKQRGVGTIDFGDAPDSYGTTLASGGPNHGVIAGFSLGATVDSETEGQPSGGANGDGADEDGVTLPALLVACSSVNATVSLTNTAAVATPRLDAWIDFDGDGAFGDPRDRIATGLALVAGANVVPVNVPCDARSVVSYSRFRLSSTGVPTAGGPAPNGEVEDYAQGVAGLDFGDAPDPAYPTLLASNGARHTVLPVANPALGPQVDTEPDGQPNAGLTGDDGSGIDDEDGVHYQVTLVPGTTPNIMVTSGATGGVVSCWIDFNRDGDWNDAGERVVTNNPMLANSTTAPAFFVPVGSPPGPAPSRCRISSQFDLGPTGPAIDGEVEDQRAPIGVEQPAIGVAKRFVDAVRDPGDPLRFSVTFEYVVENLGNVFVTDLQVTEDLATTFAPAAGFTVTSVTSPDLAVAINSGFNGTSDTNLFGPGQGLADVPIEISLVVQVDSGGEPGPYTNQVQASGDSPGGVRVTDDSQDGTDPDPNGDGSGSDNNVPTVFSLGVSVLLIPTLDWFGMLLLGALLAGVAVRKLMQRQ
jgi:hypothetical protein